MRRAPLLLLSMAVPAAARAEAWHVPEQGSLPEVIAQAAEWDTIYVDGSTYEPEGTVLVDRHLQIAALDDTPVNYPSFLVLDATLRLSGGVVWAGPIFGVSAEGHLADATAGVFVIDGLFQGHDLVIHGDGGLGIQGIDSEIDLDDCELTGATSGAAVRVYAANDDVLLYLTTTWVHDNAASGVWVQDLPPDDYVVVEIASSELAWNVSDEYGGDLRFYGVDHAEVRDSALQGSTAPAGGGSIAIFDSNLSVLATGIHGTSAAHGGALYAYGLDLTPTVDLSDVVFVDTEATDAEGLGGALSAVGVDLTLTRVEGSGATAAYGAFAAVTGGTVRATEVTVEDATAASAGGAWYISGVEEATLADSTSCATAAVSGGAVYAEFTTLTMERSVVQGVTAHDGAAVESIAGALYLLDDTFVATTGAGAVFVDAGEMEVVNTLFSGAETGLLLRDTMVPQAGYNLYWDLVVPDQDYMGYGESLYVDPRFDAGFNALDCATRPWLDPGSPALDAGDPSLLDDDGTPSDIGALPVRPEIPAGDADGDGIADDLDCDPTDPDIHPGASDDPFDTVDQDCDGDAASGTARGGCGCAGASGSGGAIAWLAALGAARRRRSHVA